MEYRWGLTLFNSRKSIPLRPIVSSNSINGSFGLGAGLEAFRGIHKPLPRLRNGRILCRSVGASANPSKPRKFLRVQFMNDRRIPSWPSFEDFKARGVNVTGFITPILQHRYLRVTPRKRESITICQKIVFLLDNYRHVERKWTGLMHLH